ncbi:MAG: hypothetical protein ABF893_15430 [Gluconacetobacter liquefaciens]
MEHFSGESERSARLMKKTSIDMTERNGVAFRRVRASVDCYGEEVRRPGDYRRQKAIATEKDGQTGRTGCRPPCE